jgi:hypothetical protein
VVAKVAKGEDNHEVGMIRVIRKEGISEWLMAAASEQ